MNKKIIGFIGLGAMGKPMALMVQQVYQAASNQGYGEQYYSIVSQWIQEQNPHLVK